jgi:hypothetical protein
VTAPAWAVLAVYAADGLVFTAAVLAIRAGRVAAVRARWAWRCRGKPPVPDDGDDLTFEEIRVLGNIAAGRDVRTRT